MSIKEVSENTVVGLSLKTIATIVGGAVIVALGYFDLKAEVELAKELPPAEVGRMEYDLKDQLIRETIMNTQTDVEDIKAQLDKMEERLFELR
jgi:Mg2+ and Co2+ transporter CorA|tara:strand:- start:435 stop:713 length:279 start_codon:yes stop_codon:yes gene_type:complete